MSITSRGDQTGAFRRGNPSHVCICHCAVSGPSLIFLKDRYRTVRRNEGHLNVPCTYPSARLLASAGAAQADPCDSLTKFGQFGHILTGVRPSLSSGLLRAFESMTRILQF